jgi:hypothetical protein
MSDRDLLVPPATRVRIPRGLSDWGEFLRRVVSPRLIGLCLGGDQSRARSPGHSRLRFLAFVQAEEVLMKIVAVSLVISAAEFRRAPPPIGTITSRELSLKSE